MTYTLYKAYDDEIYKWKLYTPFAVYSSEDLSEIVKLNQRDLSSKQGQGARNLVGVFYSTQEIIDTFPEEFI